MKRNGIALRRVPFIDPCHRKSLAMITTAENRLLTKQEAAQRLGISTRTLDRLPVRRAKIGNQVRFRTEDLNDYVAERVGR